MPLEKLTIEKRMGTPVLFAAVADVMDKRVDLSFTNVGVRGKVKVNREKRIGV